MGCGGAGRFEGGDRGALLCCDRGLGWTMRIVVDGRRGLGGGGAFEADVGEGDEYKLSFEGFRRAAGFFGGGGAILPMLELVEVRRGPGTSVSVFARRNADTTSGSSSEERSIRFATGTSFVLWTDLRAGRPGLLLG